MQHDFVDTNFGQSCSKIEIWFMLITKLRGQLLHFSFIQKFLHVGFFWAR